MNEPILVTGAAGFIGFHLSRRLLADGWTVHGLDNLNDYYDPKLKQARLAELGKNANFHFEKCELADRDAVANVFAKQRFAHVVHLAAQAGVAYSAENPAAYVNSNLVGFANILEGCRHAKCQHLVYASSSSVYGANETMPLRISDRVDEPLSLYGATKRANELMAYAYAHLYGLPATGLRFFTVYGPWGRPDMAYWLFTEAIFAGRPVRLFNDGHMRRDFTYVDDVIEAVVRLIKRPPIGSAAAASPVQCRQRTSGRSRRIARHSGKAHRQAGQARAIADACDRRARNFRRQRRPGARHRLFAAHADRTRPARVCDMVSRLLRSNVKQTRLSRLPVTLPSLAAPRFDIMSCNGHG